MCALADRQAEGAQLEQLAVSRTDVRRAALLTLFKARETLLPFSLLPAFAHVPAPVAHGGCLRPCKCSLKVALLRANERWRALPLHSVLFMADFLLICAQTTTSSRGHFVVRGRELLKKASS